MKTLTDEEKAKVEWRNGKPWLGGRRVYVCGEKNPQNRAGRRRQAKEQAKHSRNTPGIRQSIPIEDQGDSH